MPRDPQEPVRKRSRMPGQQPPATNMLAPFTRADLTLASKTTLNAKNLEALGAPRLAALLIEISAGNAALKRRLRLELAGSQDPAAAAREIRKRLTSLARAKSFIDGPRLKALLDDLETQRRAVVAQIAPNDPAEAMDLAWRFMEIADSVLERSFDRSGRLIGVFQTACADLAQLAATAKPDPQDLADRTFAALLDNDYGQYDGLIGLMAPTLGPDGLAHLKASVQRLADTPDEPIADSERAVIGWSSQGPVYADQTERSHRSWTITLALEDIADAEGDVDAYIAQYDAHARTMPRIAAEIAQRLLTAGRTEEAWATVDAVPASFRDGQWPEWEQAYVDTLEARGEHEAAQAARWHFFERWLNAEHLRAYLKRLPDFDDDEAEERALDLVMRHDSVLHALVFLLQWPALDHAAKLIIERADELDGDHYEVLTPAAELLAEKHPLAATIALRAMIDFTLGKARSSRYGHAARHLATCEALAVSIDHFDHLEPHDAYGARLQREHARKTGFWSRTTD